MTNDSIWNNARKFSRYAASGRIGFFEHVTKLGLSDWWLFEQGVNPLGRFSYYISTIVSRLLNKALAYKTNSIKRFVELNSPVVATQWRDEIRTTLTPFVPNQQALHQRLNAAHAAWTASSNNVTAKLNDGPKFPDGVVSAMGAPNVDGADGRLAAGASAAKSAMNWGTAAKVLLAGGSLLLPAWISPGTVRQTADMAYYSSWYVLWRRKVIADVNIIDSSIDTMQRVTRRIASPRTPDSGDEDGGDDDDDDDAPPAAPIVVDANLEDLQPNVEGMD
jgi:hypothetical protein